MPVQSDHPDPATPAVEMVVVQPTPFCNIDCSYCYLPSRHDKRVIAQETVATLFEKLFASGWARPEVTVVWHAGEPMVLPVAFYDQAFAAIEAMRPAHVRIKHAFQTNGTLITPAWCDFVKKWDVGLGVSVDGPRAIHDANRKTRSGKGTFDRVMAGLKLLREHGVRFHVISVLGRQSLADPRGMLDFYLDQGVDHVCFNVEESEGDHVSDLFAAGDLRARFQDFLGAFWQLARASGKIHFLREIDTMIPRIFRPSEIDMRNPQVEPLAMLNVDCLGNVSSFSPELLGYQSQEYGNFLLGNVNTDTFRQIRDAAYGSALYRDISTGVAACRQSCDYFSICGGGAPVNKLSENGSFATTRTAYCTLTQIVATDLILDSFDRLERSWTEGGPTPPPAAAQRGAAAAV